MVGIERELKKSNSARALGEPPAGRSLGGGLDGMLSHSAPPTRPVLPDVGRAERSAIRSRESPACTDGGGDAFDPVLNALVALCNAVFRAVCLYDASTTRPERNGNAYRLFWNHTLTARTSL